ncbi:hypothetical protein QM012_005207 [Aureobasidium pullulans]|uniref:DUF7770 domain-containing protein n=1 Tax=Aureobasidium pullulans TaxID=5580 RepID=A0ABR0T742_AURPU
MSTLQVPHSDWNAQVLKVRVVCHTAGRVSNTNASDNHWSIYLIIGPAKSVQFNMWAEPGYIHGNLKIKSYGYVESYSTLRYWDYEAIAYFTVGMVYGLVVERNRMHQYDMSGGGSGCRWWVYSVILALANAGWIRSDAPASLWTVLHYKYSKLQNPTPLSMVYGTFY